MKNLVTVIFLTILFTSCKVIKPDQPNLPPSPISSTPLPDSKIDVPVTFDLSSVFADFNNKIPSNFSGGGPVGPGRYVWSIQRAPFNLSLSGNSLNVLDNAQCHGAGIIRVLGRDVTVCSCDVTAVIGLNAAFNLLNNYGLSGNVTLSQFSVTPCKLTFANFDVTPILVPAATRAINSGINSLNQEINQYSIIKTVQPAWGSLLQPINISGIGYLLLNPSAVRLETPTGNQSTLHFPIGITAKPVFYLANPGPTPYSQIPNISNAAGNGFNVNLDAELAYKPLNEILNKAIQKQKITFGNKGYIKIKNAEIYGIGNNHLLIDVKFSGKYGWVCYHGNLYFTCIPNYNTSTGILYISEVNFDPGTVKAINDKAASWILNTTIKTFFNDQVHFDISNQINSLKSTLNQSINRQLSPTISLSGSVNSLNLQGILPKKDTLLIRVSTAGNLALNVKQ